MGTDCSQGRYSVLWKLCGGGGNPLGKTLGSGYVYWEERLGEQELPDEDVVRSGAHLRVASLECDRAHAAL